MTNELLFSVLIANYNNGNYLMDAVNSVYRQTYTNWEIILVDDGSIDNSNELYQELESDERIHIYLNNKNLGCGYTKRRCIELANGELCGFLDPDDALTEDALEIMVKIHEKNSQLSLVSSRYFYCDINLTISHKSNYKELNNNGHSYLDLHSMDITAFATFKKSKYALTEGINPFLQRAVDHDLYYLLEEVGEIGFTNQCLYYYRMGTGLNISIGDNYVKSVLWDLISMSDACKRRRISPEDVLFPFIIDYIENEKHFAADNVRKSRIYRVGQFFCTPIRLIKFFFRSLTKN